MLPPQHKLHRSADFAATIRRGRRLGRRTVVLHYLDTAVDGDRGRDADAQISRTGGPRVGFVVSKAVGNAVVRHAVTRKLRHVMLELIADERPDAGADADSTADAGAGDTSSTARPLIPDSVDVVVRALPASATATSQELAKDVRSALARAASR